MTSSLSKILGGALVVGLAGCGGSPTLDRSSSAVSVRNELPAPATTISTADFTNYRIGPNDELAVEVLDAPELKRQGTVDAAGNLSLPIIGNVLVGGKTLEQVSAQVAASLRGRYLKDPQVTVNVVKANSQMVTVDGAVQQPGIYPISGRMTLQQAIASAKGAGEVADLNNVVVFRTVNNQKMAALFNLKEIRAGRLNDPQVYGNDIVVVGENATRRFFRDLSIFPRLGSFVPFL